MLEKYGQAMFSFYSLILILFYIYIYLQKVISIVAYICIDIVYYIFSMVKKRSEIFKTRPHNIMQVATAYNHKCGYLLVFIFLNIDGSTSTGAKWKLEKK